jgi:hypothetical protein
MASRKPIEEFIKLAESMNETASERILSRMTDKLPKRLRKEKLTNVEAIAIQLELEDELLQEWRKNFVEIKTRAETI